MTTRWIQPITLTGEHAILEPLSLENLDGIKEAVKDGKLWFTSIPAPEKTESMAAQLGQELDAPLSIQETASYQIQGSNALFKVVGIDYANVNFEHINVMAFRQINIEASLSIEFSLK